MFKGKAIYNPAGKASEYSKWAVNFYNGCSGRCTYCYNRTGRAAKVLGGDTPTLKKSLINSELALEIFIKELDKNLKELQKDGLFFNFVSDPFLNETIELNMSAILYCLICQVPVKILTKQAWWLEEFLKEFEEWNSENLHRQNDKEYLSFGFTLTGHDELEPGCATNGERIRAMIVLNNEGFKTWASIEPIIDIESSLKMINEVKEHVDLVKIGLQSGKPYFIDDLLVMYYEINAIAETNEFNVYWKDSFLKMAGIERNELPECCVTRDFNIFTDL